MVGVVIAEQTPFLIWKSVVHSVVHSSTDSNFLQEVGKFKKWKKEAKDDDKKKEKLKLKTLEKDLAFAKAVR